MSETDFLASRTEHWARVLTAIPSVTGSQDEADFAGRLVELLRENPAFQREADAVWTLDVPGGAFPRRCVLGLMRGSGRRTVVLTGHFDIVETGGYGALQPLALDPDRLGPALIEKIAGEPLDVRSSRAAEDLKSGDFLAGRGLLDMKAGLAAGLAVIELLHGRGFAGNLLFIAVPDEEGNSAGARAISQAIADIAGARGLEIDAVINLDAMGDEGDGSDGRVVALGSVGKLLPSALVVGRAAHAADSFKGFGAPALAGALAAEVEWSPDLTERTGAELGAAPTLLGMKDSKTAYDVTTPGSVWMYWNVMVHRGAPDAVLTTMETAARRASERLRASLRERAAASGAAVAADEVDILRYEDLLAEAIGRDSAHAASLRLLEEELGTGDLSLPERCRVLTEAAFRLSGRSGPAIVLGFASIPYLPVELRGDERAARLEKAVGESARAIAQRFDTTVGTIRFFSGISDVSFFGQADDSHVDTIAANTAAWRTILGPAQRFGAAGLPSINAGPWGRDYHTRLERMHVGYGFGVLPSLILDITRRVLEGQE